MDQLKNELKRMFCKHSFILKFTCEGDWYDTGLHYEYINLAQTSIYKMLQCNKCNKKIVSGSGYKWRWHRRYNEAQSWAKFGTIPKFSTEAK